MVEVFWTPTLRRQFREAGFVKLEGIVPEPEVAQLRSEVFDPLIGKPFPTASSREKRLQVTEFTPAILALNARLSEIAFPLLGEARDALLDFVQLIKVPCTPQPTVVENLSTSYHIDGEGYLSTGGTWDLLPGFKIGIGVYLSDLSHPNRGNLMVPPGGHLIVQDYFRGPGREHFPGGKFAGNPRAVSLRLYDWIRPRLSAFTPVLAKPGDIAVFHCLLPHTVAPNWFEDRPAIYRRFGRYESPGLPALQNSLANWAV